MSNESTILKVSYISCFFKRGILPKGLGAVNLSIGKTKRFESKIAIVQPSTAKRYRIKTVKIPQHIPKMMHPFGVSGEVTGSQAKKIAEKRIPPEHRCESV